MRPTSKSHTLLLLPAMLLLLGGCAVYTTPGEPANLTAITDQGIWERFEPKPAATFPARIATVRLQSADYRAWKTTTYGKGRFSVVPVHQVETEEAFNRIAQLPNIAGLASLNRLVLPASIESIRDLRLSAAQLQADFLLVYTFDTDFQIETKPLGALATITLGMLRNREVTIVTTGSAALWDVRTGFLYGLAEATASESHKASLWTKGDVIDNARISLEREAFNKLVTEFTRLWPQVLATHARPPAGASEAPAPASES